MIPNVTFGDDVFVIDENFNIRRQPSDYSISSTDIKVYDDEVQALIVSCKLKLENDIELSRFEEREFKLYIEKYPEYAI
jgi:hypothetical protein